VDPVVDAESGLIYLRARYYDPATGQFLSRDPLVAMTGEAYGYAGDNPLNGTDPSGLFCLLGKNPNGSCRGKNEIKTAGIVVGGVALVAGFAALTVGTGGLDLGVIGLGVVSAEAVGNIALGAGAVSEGLTYLQEREDCGSGQNVSCVIDRISLATGGISLGLGGASLIGGLSAGLRGLAGIGSGVSGLFSSLSGLAAGSGIVPGRALGSGATSAPCGAQTVSA
jgi:RHS repeat-associated protein